MITKFKARPTCLSAAQAAPPMLRTTWLGMAIRLMAQCALLWLVFEASGLLVRATGLPLPQNLVGLLLLLLLLTTGVVQPDQLAEVSALVGKHLSFFFIPLVVGLMAWTELFAAYGLILAISIVGSAVLGIAIAGSGAQAINRWNERRTCTARARQS